MSGPIQLNMNIFQAFLEEILMQTGLGLGLHPFSIPR
jgi:hypothetical protein